MSLKGNETKFSKNKYTVYTKCTTTKKSYNHLISMVFSAKKKKNLKEIFDHLFVTN